MNLTYVRVHTSAPGACAKCGRPLELLAIELSDGLLYGDECARLLCGTAPWRDIRRDDLPPVPPEVLAVQRETRPRITVAKFDGDCSCGRSIRRLDVIVFAPGEGAIGCPGCDSGRGPALDPPPHLRADMDAAWHDADTARSKHLREHARRLAVRLTARWMRLSPEQAKRGSR